MSELVDKQVNVQKESLKKLPGFTQNFRKPTKKCAMKMKQTNKEKKRRAPKIFLMEEGVYKARAENSYHGLQINDSSYIEGTICLVNE